MKKLLMTFAAFLVAASLLAAARPDFSGSWQFAPKESRNAGMMAGISMVATITQTADEIIITYDMAMEEQKGKIVQRFELSGKPVDNPTQMGGHAETTSQLTESELVTTWTSTAPSGAKLTRTETWSLSPDGKLLTITSVRGNGAPGGHGFREAVRLRVSRHADARRADHSPRTDPSIHLGPDRGHDKISGRRRSRL